MRESCVNRGGRGGSFNVGPYNTYQSLRDKAWQGRRCIACGTTSSKSSVICRSICFVVPGSCSFLVLVMFFSCLGRSSIPVLRRITEMFTASRVTSEASRGQHLFSGNASRRKFSHLVSRDSLKYSIFYSASRVSCIASRKSCIASRATPQRSYLEMTSYSLIGCHYPSGTQTRRPVSYLSHSFLNKNDRTRRVSRLGSSAPVSKKGAFFDG